MLQSSKSSCLLLVSRETSAVNPLLSAGKTDGWQWEQAESGWEALERLQEGAAADLILLDLERGDADALHTLRWLRRVRPELPVVLLSYSSDPEHRVEAIRLGARDFLVKPMNAAQLEAAIGRHLSKRGGETIAHPSSLNSESDATDEGLLFVAASPAMRHLRAQAELVAQVNAPLLILGERGSGKQITARLIHKLSLRSGLPFVKVNCAALPGNLLEDELFGADHGVFGSAGQGRESRFEANREGTLYLDEITELPGVLQHRLLQILQERHHNHSRGDRSPGNQSRAGEVRILAATGADIDQALSEHRLREDLYYRLSAFSIYVPPLRRRAEDIPLLLTHLMNRMAKQYGLPQRPLPAAIIEACLHYGWPENLRELESFVKRYLVVGDEELAIAELARKTEGRHGGVHGIHSVSAEERESNGHHSHHGHGVDLEASTGEDSGLKSLVQNIKGETERHAIASALVQTAWNRKAAARLLKVSYRTLLYKIQQYHMTPPEHFLPHGHAAHGRTHESPLGPGNGVRNGGSTS